MFSVGKTKPYVSMWEYKNGAQVAFLFGRKTICKYIFDFILLRLRLPVSHRNRISYLSNHLWLFVIRFTYEQYFSQTTRTQTVHSVAKCALVSPIAIIFIYSTAFWVGSRRMFSISFLWLSFAAISIYPFSLSLTKPVSQPASQPTFLARREKNIKRQLNRNHVHSKA